MINYTYVNDAEKNIRWFVLTQDWDKEVKDFILQNRIDSLLLSYTNGWNATDLNFLQDVNGIRNLRVLHSEVHDISAISNLSQLNYLHLKTGRFNKNIDFSALRKLQCCRLYWFDGLDSIFNCEAMEELSLDGYNRMDLNALAGLKRLQVLRINNGKKLTGLSGVGTLDKLKTLELAYLPKLENIIDLHFLTNLEQLILRFCKRISNINPIGFLKKLNYLWLDEDGEIESLKPIEGCRNLKKLVFVGTNIKDGEISFLKKLPTLTYVNFDNKKHYTNKREEYSQQPDIKPV